ncbi:MAG: GNAT family N-acetyltransferase [Stellaceae bacterium]
MTAGARIQLRRWRADDLEALVRYANNRNVSRNIRDRFPYPYTRTDAEAWITLCDQQGEPVLNFAIDLDGEAIGGIGFERFTDVHRLTVEIGYWLGEPFWGRGIATAALMRATIYGFETLGVERIEAGVFDGNSASARVLEKAGYTFEGRLRRSVFKDGHILDSLLYSRIK